MKKLYFLLVFTIISISFFSSCKKDSNNELKEFVGIWEGNNLGINSDNYWIIKIQKNGDYDYQEHQPKKKQVWHFKGKCEKIDDEIVSLPYSSLTVSSSEGMWQLDANARTFNNEGVYYLRRDGAFSNSLNDFYNPRHGVFLTRTE